MAEISNPWTVDGALAAMSVDRSREGSASPVPYFHLLERLKTTKRAGWRRFGINQGESIADHMYRMALMSMLPPPALMKSLDLDKCIKMCLIHDMAESVVGDLTPADGVSKPEKNRREGSTMDYITANLLGNIYGGTSPIGGEIRAIWQEHEDSKTLESRFVQDIDKIELLLQMVEYEKLQGGDVDLNEFTYVATKVHLPEMKDWAQQILDERTQFWGAKEKNDTSSQIREMQDKYYGD